METQRLSKPKEARWLVKSEFNSRLDYETAINLLYIIISNPSNIFAVQQYKHYFPLKLRLNRNPFSSESFSFPDAFFFNEYFLANGSLNKSRHVIF